MKVTRFAKSPGLTIFVGLSLLVPAAISAQAPAGPLSAAVSSCSRVCGETASAASTSANDHFGSVEAES
jgi:hypothetical protein